ncbi:phage terminase large subunit [Flaviflagellibacter deserti]|uniref:Phage terminase large subunit n=1 Tax=Flaviflagellibacter deserti TaxID=2267266 RepID=A0ABV9YWQ5_9HYPH
MSDRRRLLQAVLRSDLQSFIAKVFTTLEPGTPYQDNWHLHAIAHALTRVWLGETTRLIINVPPRMMKSIAVTQAFSAWVLGHDPTKRILTVTYAREFARKQALDFKTVVESEWFTDLFPDCRIDQRRSRGIEIVTSLQGSRYAGAMGGGVLGRGGDLIIIDDPIKAVDAVSEAERRRVNETYSNTLYTRLNSKRVGAIVIIMQRLHEDDLVGHVLDRDEWEVLSIPAIASEEMTYRTGAGPDDVYVRPIGEVLHAKRESAAELELIRRNIGSMEFSAQYQQSPVPLDGNLIHRDWLRFYDGPPEAFDYVVASWDTASTIEEVSDWSVGTIWGAREQSFYLLDVKRVRLEVPELRRLIVETSLLHNVDATLIEDTELGRAIAQDLRRQKLLRCILRKPRYDKTARLLVQAARFEAGQVVLPRQAPWLDDFIAELLAFPRGRHDDQVDSTSQALSELTQRTSRHLIDQRLAAKPRPRTRRRLRKT